MPDDADLSLPALATMIADFLTELDQRHVAVVCNDWGGAQLLMSPGGTDRVANLVLVSCEAFDNYPPGVPGRLLYLNAALPGGTFLTAQLLRPRWIRHLPVTFGALSKRRVPEDLFRSWIHPLRHNPKVRRDLPPQRPQAAAAELHSERDTLARSNSQSATNTEAQTRPSTAPRVAPFSRMGMH